MNENKIEILCTLGPGSDEPSVIRKLQEAGMSYSRINLSHSSLKYCEELIKKLKKNSTVPIILDTQGPQIRTGELKKKFIALEENKEITLYKKDVLGDEKNITIFPAIVLDQLNIGDLLSIDFDSALVKVLAINKKQGKVKCIAVNGGIVGSNKAVTLEFGNVKLPVLTEKDKKAIALAIKNGIRMFALSFVNKADDVLMARDFCRKFTEDKIILIAKVETKKALEDLDNIIKTADAILVDRGDLSRDIGIEKVPFTQKIVIKKCIENNKRVYVATNLLESMISKSKPTRAEVNDIVNTILDGASGLALCAETAIGKYPVESALMLNKLIKHAFLAMNPDMENKEHDKKAYPEDDVNSILDSKENSKVIDRLKELNYITSDLSVTSLIEPHGGKLIDRAVNNISQKYTNSLKKLIVEKETLMDAEQIAIGTFSPLEGFMKKKDLISVLDNMRLANGVIWPLPIILHADESFARKLKTGKDGEDIALAGEDNQIYTILNAEEIYKIDKNEACQKLYGTTDITHPGVKNLMEKSNTLIGGKITLIKKLPSEFKHHELTPSQSRKIFEEKGWSKVVGFHTRNVIHRSHEYIQLYALNKENCDGLFVHPVIGKKKKGDFNAKYIINSYQMMANDFYPKNKVVFGVFATFSRYAGPREAIFTAICRKNFGCSHFIVGRDHTGVGNFYDPYASHKIFDRFPDLGIKPILFDEMFYCVKCKAHSQKLICKHDKKHFLQISGTEARNIFKTGKMPPAWFMRSKIAKMIIQSVKKGENVFVE